MKKPAQHLIAEVPRRQARPELTIGVGRGYGTPPYTTFRHTISGCS
jgi:hypothetical protein